MRSTKYLDSKVQDYEQAYQKAMNAFVRYDHQQLTAQQCILLQNEALEEARLKYLELMQEHRQMLLDQEIEHQERLNDVLQTVKDYEMVREDR